MSRPLRTSCDRCHSQKLKCPKQPGVATCSRCLKAGASCVFSPAGPSVRRARGSHVQLQSPYDSNIDMQFEWPPLDFESPLENPIVTPTDLLQEPQIVVTQEVGQTEAAALDPRSTCVHQLANLAVEIDKVYLKLLPQSLIHMPKEQPFEDFINRITHNFNQRQCLEQLFTLSQGLIDLYPQVLEVIFDEPKPSNCQDSECFHAVELPHEIEVLFSTLEENAHDIDIFVFNLLISCHSKVTDVIGGFLKLARTCTRFTVASPDQTEPRHHIPELRVGNFVASGSSSSAMQTVLLIHISSVLVDYTQELSKRVTERTAHGRNSKHNQMLKLQCDILEENASSRLKQLQSVMSAIKKLGFMK
ncbi:hypothetical protein F5B20DRAFT_187645 [Whalleya microplaca]|nr:hypothetical protein F5B20DRAFT_187645 [Whalleya microplaca]